MAYLMYAIFLMLLTNILYKGDAMSIAKRIKVIEINTALCVIDRETGGKEALKEQGIELLSLLTATDLV